METFSYGHYYARFPSNYERIVQSWIRDVNDTAYPILIEVLGFKPKINHYIVDFKNIDINLRKYGVVAYYAGVKTIDDISGGYIAVDPVLIDDLKEYPKNLEGGIVYETIHGFLQPLKFRKSWNRNTILKTDESFDIIFEVEFDNRIGLIDFKNHLYNQFYHTSSANSGQIYFSLLWDIRERYGWKPIQQFFKMLRDGDTALVIEGDVDGFYTILNSLICEDIWQLFENHGF